MQGNCSLNVRKPKDSQVKLIKAGCNLRSQGTKGRLGQYGLFQYNYRDTSIKLCQKLQKKNHPDLALSHLAKVKIRLVNSGDPVIIIKDT
jgi:hypothetical protein